MEYITYPKKKKNCELYNQDIQEAHLPESFVRGLSTAHIPGRAQIVYDTYSKSNNSLEVSENSCGDLTFYLDGAHSPESMEACAKWFSSAVKGNKISSSSSLKVKKLEEVWANSHIRHESESMEESNKLIKQVKLHDKQPGVVSGFMFRGVSGQLMVIHYHGIYIY